MPDYPAKRDKAKKKIESAGMPMIYANVTEDTSGNFDPETGGYPVVVVKTPFSGVRTRPTVAEVQAGMFQGVSLVILAPGDIKGGETPDTTDVLQFDGRDWDIVEIVPVAPAETVLAYKLGLQDAGEMDTSERLRLNAKS